MTPEQLLMLMRFQLSLAQAIYGATPSGEDTSHFDAHRHFEEARKIVTDFEKELTPPPPPDDKWALRFIDTEGGYVGQVGRCESISPKMLVWPDSFGALAYAKNNNIWRMVEAELIRG